MSAQSTPARGNTPTAPPSLRRVGDEDHAPAIPSPLNPAPRTASKPALREPREKKDSLKKREAAAATRSSTPADTGSRGKKGAKAAAAASPSPMRYQIPEPRFADYDPPKDPVFASHEPNPFFTPNGVELRKPIDHAENKKAYRYTHAIADPLFRHKQFYRQTDSKPQGPRMSVEDSDKLTHFDDSMTMITNEKGWRMSRANVFAREGSLYYEVKVVRGIAPDGPAPTTPDSPPEPHIRMGWARREAPLDSPVGFDGYSYGIADMRCAPMHRSRPGKFLDKQKTKGKPKSKAAARQEPPPPEDHIRTGDVIGLLITLPSLSLHRKVVEGIYNPAVDVDDGFTDPPGPAADIIRDRIPVPYRSNLYFEQFEYQPTKAMETYNDRSPINTITPHPNHPDAALRTLPHSSIRVYKNGIPLGTAFEGLLAFLPPASLVPASTGARPGFDDGTIGYYPAVSMFSGGIAELNFGPGFWFPPPELGIRSSRHPQGAPVPADMPATGADADGDGDGDIMLPDAPTSITSPMHGGPPEPKSAGDEKRRVRGVGERYREQVAEDVVWDLVDEVDFFAQDGGYAYVPERDSPEVKRGTARGVANLRDE
ncbi:hypothetical protein EJ06DRAFT_584254 [Trichodelitschia bisporula]|uniref:SPRY domain-containing protein n=1 Tax=Trichodelitschia bisporula TaxID=703511 RepID=A0A6G1HPC9_9PEZI|nr:hypothetical protein EJ06DRAFT_584254 [Trichodelitschia bisporula]